ncbi:hypothetical protein EDC22_103182 [Tepidamorphus gemmatus]|jgi:hypothetical protein|uniref:Transmembrane protein n=1 Tax=Tepidamorphus gemmatus TaxID=747076 RepID=A0A4R3MHL8_9HYPH|nr:hypothetical protein [Tepidamorphus gemmatus]TCT11869.1 hypothetical protein EDC22_103182 [Tepidamorphus gemmatus]
MYGLPLMILPLIGYNALEFLFGGVDWKAALFDVDMMSGAVWTMTASDVFLLVALLLLFVEVLKATRTTSMSIVDHLLSTLVFVGCLVEFLLVARAATSTFFLLTAIAFVDVVAGFSITIRAARRDFAIGPHGEG